MCVTSLLCGPWANLWPFDGLYCKWYSKRLTVPEKDKTPKVVSVGCVGLWKHNGVLSEFGKIRETGKMCHVMSIDE